MTALINLFAPRIKAVVAFVASGVVSYIATAVVTGHALTLHGLEVAASTAVLAAIGVHQSPANRKPKTT